MKKTPLLFLLAVNLLFLISCGVDKKETTEKIPPTGKNRNMFGHGIKRGLTLNTKEVTDGYVMFAVPNSASVYLVNRQGEVVHEWKGNYGVMGAYLSNDGSLVQNAHDPDFPVFAGGG